ncbi:MAG: Fic family protein [Candidatus Woesearchaeota archaeon]
MLNKKDMISINMEVGETGELQNEGSLEFALSIIRQKKSWLYELAYILRSLLADHAFRDGNKRTALALVLAYLDERKMECDKEKLVRKLYNISKNNIADINRIVRMIKDAVYS